MVSNIILTFWKFPKCWPNLQLGTHYSLQNYFKHTRTSHFCFWRILFFRSDDVDTWTCWKAFASLFLKVHMPFELWTLKTGFSRLCNFENAHNCKLSNLRYWFPKVKMKLWNFETSELWKLETSKLWRIEILKLWNFETLKLITHLRNRYNKLKIWYW